MQYLLNGGRDERGLLRSSKSLNIYSDLGIKRLLMIPLAIVEEYWQEVWHGNENLFGIPNIETKTLTELDTDRQAILERINWADFIYFPGGAQKTLLRRLKEMDLIDVLQAAVTNNPLKLLGGGSAGAMVMGSRCIIGRNSIESIVDGLAFLPNCVIDSHFSNRNREPRLLQVLGREDNVRGLGIDENTAVLLSDEFIIQDVYGTGTVSVYIKDKKTVYDSNSQFNS